MSQFEDWLKGSKVKLYGANEKVHIENIIDENGKIKSTVSTYEKLTIDEIIERYGDHLTEEQIQELKNRTNVK